MTGRIEIIINGKINAIRDFTSWKEMDTHIDRWKASLIATLTTDGKYEIVAFIESDFKSKRKLHEK